METYTTDYGTIYLSDNRDVLPLLEENSIDAMVTDPPYGFKMKYSEWDYNIPTVDFWKETLRVLKPGAFALVASGTRIQHRMATNLEDAGFEIRDIIAFVYSCGYPKTSDLGKSISEKWSGWKTTIKPAMELWTLARKPLINNSIKDNLNEYSTGALNIDACRIYNKNLKPWKKTEKGNHKYGYAYHPGKDVPDDNVRTYSSSKGREPCNFIYDGSDEVEKLFPNNASRFFYGAKINQSERNAGISIENDHPTVKTLSLTKYLVKLITPPNGIVLDPFLGSGTTAIACIEENFHYIGIEQDAHYFDICKQRINHCLSQLTLL